MTDREVAALQAALTAALAEEKRSQKNFARPYSGHDAARRFYHAQGRTSGIAHAMEVLGIGAPKAAAK